ncbi:hypothetical protein GCM10007939_14220 [Amylibacter marinus]|uniref:HTH tetR-type domain-containing protein n=1 Tax=Amylibacter marinus TaxID=1475483 RepID=A0ABQ5VV19_9RHOB|nr:TetR/AcrR family transcriptional regulator [Amylibacter marinus]GLQ35139.1 hypothetical protein GCM10007939_14220 [Amylibacter marinus]
MKRPIQKRSLATRAKLIASAQKILTSKDFGALRVEEVVLNAGVAKGTFFAHFPDKDALMERVVSDEINAHLDRIEKQPPPTNLDSLLRQFMPLLQFMTSERYVFDLILRHSGAAAKEEIGPIAQTFGRQIGVLTKWISVGPFRKDVPALILAEGVQAFAIQSMALDFCAINSEMPMHARLRSYLEPWLRPDTLS